MQLMLQKSHSKKLIASKTAFLKLNFLVFLCINHINANSVFLLRYKLISILRFPKNRNDHSIHIFLILQIFIVLKLNIFLSTLVLS